MASPAGTQDIRFGKHVLRVQQQRGGWAGIVLGKSTERFQAENREELVRKLERAVAEGHGEFVGWPQAIALFRRRHPDGFGDESYGRLERDDKEAAARLLTDIAPLEAALDADGLAADVVRVFTAPKLQLVNRFEVGKARAMLTGPDGDSFLRAAALFCVDPTSRHLEALRTVAEPHRAQSWPVLTVLPWLWAPESQVYVKPEETKSFSRAVGHPFHELYTGAAPFGVYEAARDLAREVLTETAGLGARDNIDAQGFIHVVCHPRLVPQTPES